MRLSTSAALAAAFLLAGCEQRQTEGEALAEEAYEIAHQANARAEALEYEVEDLRSELDSARAEISDLEYGLAAVENQTR